MSAVACYAIDRHPKRPAGPETGEKSGACRRIIPRTGFSIVLSDNNPLQQLAFSKTHRI